MFEVYEKEEEKSMQFREFIRSLSTTGIPIANYHISYPNISCTEVWKEANKIIATPHDGCTMVEEHWKSMGTEMMDSEHEYNILDGDHEDNSMDAWVHSDLFNVCKNHHDTTSSSTDTFFNATSVDPSFISSSPSSETLIFSNSFNVKKRMNTPSEYDLCSFRDNVDECVDSPTEIPLETLLVVQSLKLPQSPESPIATKSLQLLTTPLLTIPVTTAADARNVDVGTRIQKQKYGKNKDGTQRKQRRRKLEMMLPKRVDVMGFTKDDRCTMSWLNDTPPFECIAAPPFTPSEAASPLKLKKTLDRMKMKNKKHDEKDEKKYYDERQRNALKNFFAPPLRSLTSSAVNESSKVLKS
jgi:hypothetical protein